MARWAVRKYRNGCESGIRECSMENDELYEVDNTDIRMQPVNVQQRTADLRISAGNDDINILLRR